MHKYQAVFAQLYGAALEDESARDGEEVQRAGKANGGRGQSGQGRFHGLFIGGVAFSFFSHFPRYTTESATYTARCGRNIKDECCTRAAAPRRVLSHQLQQWPRRTCAARSARPPTHRPTSTPCHAGCVRYNAVYFDLCALGELKKRHAAIYQRGALLCAIHRKLSPDGFCE